MSNFKIDTEDLRKLEAWFKQDSNSALLMPDISMSILKFHNTLETRVSSVFTAKVKLSSVKVGGNSINGKKGIDGLSFTLEYKEKPLRLDQFKFQTVDSDAISFAPVRLPSGDPLGFVKWTEGQHSKQVNVEVIRGKINTGTYGKQRPAFRVKNGNKIRLRARKQDATWAEYPSGKSGDSPASKGIYAPTGGLFGPPLVTQASSLFDKDRATQKAWIKMQDEIVNTLVKSYR